ncbi:MAG: hypothetical protein AB7V58_00475 [Solirubrobacterales bacterium]
MVRGFAAGYRATLMLAAAVPALAALAAGSAFAFEADPAQGGL